MSFYKSFQRFPSPRTTPSALEAEQDGSGSSPEEQAQGFWDLLGPFFSNAYTPVDTPEALGTKVALKSWYLPQ